MRKIGFAFGAFSTRQRVFAEIFL